MEIHKPFKSLPPHLAAERKALVKKRRELFNLIPDAQVRKRVRRKLHPYGLKVEQYYELLEYQGYVCAICKKEGRPKIDHDHKTGKVRGILCNHCNAGLGFFKDDINLLMAAIEYLSVDQQHLIDAKRFHALSLKRQSADLTSTTKV